VKAPSGVTARPRILVVEDEAVVALDVKARLQGLGYEVIGPSSTGEEALAKAAEARPDLVLMDIKLRGDLDGIEAARLLRDRLDIPVVYLTAYADPATLERAKLAEPLGFVLKPFAERELHAVVEMALYKRRMESRLRESRSRLDAMLRGISDGVLAVNAKGNVTFANPAAERMTGFASAEMLDRPLRELVVLLGEERREPRDPLGSDGAGDALLVGRSGAERPVSVSVSPLEEGGRDKGNVLVLSDLTERRLHERARLEEEERRRHAQRLETVGRLAGGIAHDFNNLLTTVLGYSDLLLARVEPGSAFHDDLQEIRRAGERAAALTSQLLAFSRKQILEPQVLDINRLVDGVTRMLRRLIGEEVSLSCRSEPALWRVRADPGQLEQVLVNLALNARDAMPGGGTLTIETRNDVVDEGDGGALPVGSYAVLSVRDTGVGMDADTLARAFEPFFTTKEKGKGTGLGLATVHGIVSQSGGHVRCESAPGRGALFTVWLPRVEESESGEMPHLSDESPRGAGVVVLVEDEEPVRRLTRRILEARGYSVLDAPSGDEALKVIDGRVPHVDLLVTDVVMPEKTGPQVAELLLSRYPAMKVLYISGYTDKVIAKHGVLEPGIALLKKPFTPDALAREVRRVIGR
jgi:PAS domain S-box-containing protein